MTKYVPPVAATTAVAKKSKRKRAQHDSSVGDVEMPD